MKKGINIICTLCLILLAGSALWAGVQIVTLNMLAPKFLYPVLAILALLVLLLGFFMAPKIGKKERKAAGRIVCCILSLLCSAGFVMGAMTVAKANETIDTITDAPAHSTVVEVYVTRDSGTAAPEEVQTFGWSEAFDGESVTKAVEALEQERGEKLQLLHFDSVPQMVDALYAGEADGILLSSAYVGILESIEGYGDFRDRTNSIYSLSVQVESDASEEEAAEEEKKPEEASFLVYLSGVDTKEEGATAGLSDVNILAAVNPNTRQVLLINSPRDLFVPNPASGTGALDKLTHCGAYGVENSMKVLSSLYGEEVRYYARINFTGFETLIDALGGVTVQSDYDFDSGGCHFQKGANEVNGKQALIFARTRQVFTEQDMQRGRHQMNLIRAIVDKVTSSTTMITNYAQIMESLQGMFTTNVPRDMISHMVRLQLEDMSPWNIQTYTSNGTSDMQHTYSTGNFRAYVMWPNEAAMEKGHDLIEAIFSGEPITPDMLVTPEAPPLETEEEE